MTNPARDVVDPSLAKEAALAEWLRAHGPVAIGYSGGVDSAFLAVAARETLGRRGVLAIIGRSPSYPRQQWIAAREVADQFDVPVLELDTAELDDPRYAANPSDRCYFCKTELYDVLAELAAHRGYATLLSGANQDDQGDWRPGLRAAAEHGVVHPLHDVTKPQVRELARRLRLPSAEKPASPCLASRIPYGTAVDPHTLHQIDAAERAVRARGFPVLRVRHHGILGRLEVAAEDLDRALADEPAIVEAIKAAGYAHAVIDREPFRSGRLNAARARPAASR